MKIQMIGAFIRNAPYGTEIAFKKGFDRIGGHEVNVIDPSQPNQKWELNPDATLVFKYIEQPAQMEMLGNVSGHKIVYQPDDLRFPHIKQMMTEMRQHCDNALTFDDDGAELALSYGYKAAQKFLLTADNDLYKYIFHFYHLYF